MKSLLGGVQRGLSGPLSGAACACVVLFAVEWLLILGEPHARHWLAKENERRRAIVEWMSQYGLPGALALGAIVGMSLQRVRPFLLGVVGLAGCCFAIAFFALMLRPPMLATAGPPNAPLPLPEAVPDAIATTFGWLGLTIAAFGIVWHISWQFRCGGPGMVQRVLHKSGAAVMCAGVLLILSAGIALSVRPVQWCGAGVVLVGMLLTVAAAFGGMPNQALEQPRDGV
jgi:hypothetical protein